jgi:hypothetical protein
MRCFGTTSVPDPCSESMAVTMYRNRLKLGRFLPFGLLAFTLGWPKALANVDQGRPCATDIGRFCNEVRAGEGRLLECLNEHQSELSQGCRKALTALSATPVPVCKKNSESSLGTIHQAMGHFVFQSGVRDVEGNLLGGTEVRDLVAFQGKLYAGLGQWMDQPANGDPHLPAEIIVLERPNGRWRLEASFPEKVRAGVNRGLYRYQAVAGLYRLHLSPQVEALGAVFWVTAGSATVVLRSPETGQWVDTGFGDHFTRFLQKHGVARPYLGETRVLRTYTDSATGQTYLFVTTVSPGGMHGPAGTVSHVVRSVTVGSTIWKGRYDPRSPRLIRWDDQPEANFNGVDLPLASRVVLLYDDAGVLYCGVHVQYLGSLENVQSAFLARRVDGFHPTWKVEVFPDRDHHLTAIRGMIRLRGVAGQGIQYVLSGEANGRIYRYETEKRQVMLEWDARKWFWENTCYGSPRSRILWYRSSEYENAEVRHGEQLLVTGGYFDHYWDVPDSEAPNGVLKEAYYGYRTADGTWHLGQLIDASRHPMPRLNGTHNFEISPFPEDKGGYLYVGFFGGDPKVHSHNTARIMRVSAHELFPEN